MLLQRSTLGVGSGVAGGSRRSSPCLHARPACGTMAVAVGVRQQGRGASRGSSVAVRGQEPGQEVGGSVRGGPAARMAVA